MAQCRSLTFCDLCLESNCLWAALHSGETLCVPSKRPYLNGMEVSTLAFKGEEGLCEAADGVSPTSNKESSMDAGVVKTTPTGAKIIPSLPTDSGQRDTPYIAGSTATPEGPTGPFVGGMFLGILLGTTLCTLVVWLILRWNKRQIQRAFNRRPMQREIHQALTSPRHPLETPTLRVPPSRPPPPTALVHVEELEMQDLSSTNPFRHYIKLPTEQENHDDRFRVWDEETGAFFEDVPLTPPPI